MWYEQTAFVALGIAAIASLALATFLGTSLRPILAEYSGSKIRGRFWAAIIQSVIALVPIGIILGLGRITEAPGTVSFPDLFDQLKWACLGMVASLASLALIVGLYGRVHGATVQIDHEQFEDLNRLLSKVREMRARELLDQIAREKSDAPR